jgi:mRNA-degrading endonuclease YafQ of YafQ-DinJ toxin-antitoxin module
MRTIERSTQFKRDYKKYAKSIDAAKLEQRLHEIVSCLVADGIPSLIAISLL